MFALGCQTAPQRKYSLQPARWLSLPPALQSRGPVAQAGARMGVQGLLAALSFQDGLAQAQRGAQARWTARQVLARSNPTHGTRGHLQVFLQHPCLALAQVSASPEEASHSWPHHRSGCVPPRHSPSAPQRRAGGLGVLGREPEPTLGSPNAQLSGDQHADRGIPSASSSPCHPAPFAKRGWETSSPLVRGHQQVLRCSPS